MTRRRPIVFLGPSMPREVARAILDADYRRPVRRGDLEDLPPGQVVGIIDGEFDQSLSVSPREIRDALQRGVRFMGSSSMGALRAVEVPGVVGVGRVFEMFRSGAIDSDDEVAVLFDAESCRCLTVPLVNVRFATARLAQSDTIDRAIAARIVAAATKLPYVERTYPAILARAGLDRRQDARLLVDQLEAIDLKREDAQTLLERLPAFARDVAGRRIARPAAGGGPRPAPLAPAAATPARGPADPDRLWHWEYGERVKLPDLLRFLKLTGRFPALARAAVARLLLAGHPLPPGRATSRLSMTEMDLVREALRSDNGWWTEEEATACLEAFGLRLGAVKAAASDEIAALQLVNEIAEVGSAEFLGSLRLELLLDNLALKREVLRCGSLPLLARRGGQPGAERNRARQKLCMLLDVVDWATALATLEAWGVTADQAAAFVDELARARRAVGELWRPYARPRRAPARRGRVALRPSPKAAGSGRFCLTLQEAYPLTRRLRATVGITRVGLVHRLTALDIPVAQAFRPGKPWSSTVSSGKSPTVLGARVGAVMEDVETYAVERFTLEGRRAARLVGSFDGLRRAGRAAVDPAELPLPFDSVYRPDRPVEWLEAWDLLNDRPVLVPASMVVLERLKDDLLHSEHAARKLLDSNGLGSGFTLEEAIVHATCEAIERHNARMAEVIVGNPGQEAGAPYRFVDLASLPPVPAALVKKFARGGHTVRILDITADIAVPTFHATAFEDLGDNWPFYGGRLRSAGGTGTHPDPEVAVVMALCEAAQTKIGNVAGSREDLTVKVRSLGRHERTRTCPRAMRHFWLDVDAPMEGLADVKGARHGDARQDAEWILARLAERGVKSLPVVDLSQDELRPARVVRVFLPGLESPNPYHCGLRARALALADLLGTPVARQWPAHASHAARFVGRRTRTPG